MVSHQPCDDFELLLKEDGSYGDSLEICKSYESGRVKVYIHANKNLLVFGIWS